MPPHPVLRLCSCAATPYGGLILLTLLIGFATTPVVADETARRRFDIPAGEALVTLKRAAQQAELEIVYAATLVEGVQTRAVTGDFTPIEALERMVEDTVLKIFHDPRTGALSVMRRADPEPHASTPDPANEPQRGMKRRNPIAVFTGWLALALGPAISAPAGEAGTQATARAAGAISGRVQNVATGLYLNNARVSVRGTDLVTFTDETGTYRLREVPAGTVTLEVFYTGLDPQTVALDIPPGQTVSRDVDLTSVARYGSGSVVQLDAFTVSSSRETDAAAIAINEQRFAPNIKNVVAADSLGDVMDGNIGEFMKFLPGLTAEYDRSDDASSVSGISLRGFGSSLVSISADGAQVANTSGATGDSRGFFFNQISINNISRIEITKVPTPATAADSLAGAVNLVSKSAFERSARQLRYTVNLAASSLAPIKFRRTPHTNDQRVYKIRPGVNFDFTWPISRNFGVVVTGMSSNRYNKLQESRTTYNAGGTGTGASFARPFLQQYTMVDSPRLVERNSLGLKADWRVTPGSVLSFGIQGSHYELKKFPTAWTFNAGTNAAPTPATGVRMSFGDDFTIGATGRGVFQTANAASTERVIDSAAGNINYRFDNGTWRVMASNNHSMSEGGNRDIRRGHFRQYAVRLRDSARISFLEINPIRPGRIQVFDNSDREIDYYDPANYVLATANATPRHTRDTINTSSLDVRRTLGFLPFPASLQLGGSQRVQVRDNRRENITWTYSGINGDFSPLPYLSPVYVNQESAFGFRNLPHISTIIGWNAFRNDPALFRLTPAQSVAAETFRINNSEHLRETVTALYTQAELTLLRGRLQVLGGVRYEKTVDRGEGALRNPTAVFVRSADGGFARDAGGNRIRKPEAGAAGSLEELRLILEERAFRARRAYHDYYPSLHLNYRWSENLLARLAYARTYGRPNFTDILPNIDIDEDNLRITTRNPGLRPWHADNYDFSLEYYTDAGGIISLGVFRKEVTDFFGSATRMATAADLERFGLDSSYAGWDVRTRFNIPGTARVNGAEVNLRQSLERLGRWGRHLAVFANGTKLWIGGTERSPFTQSAPESFNFGLSVSRKPLLFMAKWNYRGRQRGTEIPSLGPDAFEYEEARQTLDLNLEYHWSRRISLFANAQNVFNEPIVTLRRGSETPAYAQRMLTSVTGATFAVGLKGTY
jgi:iron complex outermembrane recepter protein